MPEAVVPEQLELAQLAVLVAAVLVRLVQSLLLGKAEPLTLVEAEAEVSGLIQDHQELVAQE
jgi:hypothetical protein